MIQITTKICFFVGLCAIFSLNFVNISLAVAEQFLHNHANKQTNKQINKWQWKQTSLMKVIKQNK